MSRRTPAPRGAGGKGGRSKKRRAGREPTQQEIQRLMDLYRGGRYGEAATAAREFTHRFPEHAVGWSALAASRDALGQPEAAAKAWRRAVRIEPANTGAHNNLGNALRAAGDPAGAAEAFRAALRGEPAKPEFHFNLGLALLDAGGPTEALAAFDRVRQLRPGLAEADNARGNALRALDRPGEAVAAFEAALAAHPDATDFRANLANALRELGRLEEAERHCRTAMEARPDDPGLRLNLGLILADLGRTQEAETLFRAVLADHPASAPALHNLGYLLVETGRRDEGEACYREALRLDPELAPAHQALGNLLLDRNDLAAAEAAHRQALALRRDSPVAHRDLGIVLSVLGRREEAERCFRDALALQPDYASAYAYLAAIKRFGADDPDLVAMEALLEREDLGDDDRGALHYALARAYDQAGQPSDRVFDHARRGAALKRQGIDYDIGAEEGRFQRIAAAIDRVPAPGTTDGGDPSDAPVFIVGMPRSGTTLVEQILASHPAVHGADERGDLERIVREHDRATGTVFPEWVADLTDGEATSLGGAYRAAVIDSAPAARRVTDKMPENFRFLGLIPRILPHARIVHIEREPADTCLSCYLHRFLDKAPWSYDLTELGRYYRAYHRLMAHWRAILPASTLLELRYEDLVAQPETQIHRLLDFCGLDHDPACLAFHRTERAVPTPSLVQVRQPMYRDAIDRWRPYAEQLAPLFEALGPLAPAD